MGETMDSIIFGLLFSGKTQKPIPIRKATLTKDNRDTCSLDQVELDCRHHISDVQKGVGFLASKLILQAETHDHTKIEHLEDFLHDFQQDFKGEGLRGWWDLHLTERHHLNSKPPEDVNLLDVIEMLVDGCVAGAARTGIESVYDIELSSDLLQQALRNTQKLIMDNMGVVDDGNTQRETDGDN